MNHKITPNGIPNDSIAAQSALGDAPGRSFKKAVKPLKARGLVDYLQGAFSASIRKAFKILLFQKPPYSYKPRHPSQASQQRIREIAETCVCYGYRRIHVLPQPEGADNVWAMNFLSDQLFDSRKIRVVTTVEAFTKLSSAIARV